MRLLIANRGEIALRILRTAADLDLETIAVHSGDDADLPHVRAATRAVALPGVGPAAYLDQAVLLTAIEHTGADLVHPGYGFLAENADFARACGPRFVGPAADHLDLLGDKSAARHAARDAQVPVLPGTDGPSTVAQMRDLLAAEPAGIMVKALAGGGGRGMREVRTVTELDDAVARCSAEALAAFGNGDLFAEALLPRARHVEVQIVADGRSALALGDRDCSVQHRHQKLVEFAPALHLDGDTRQRMHAAAQRLCASIGYRGLATVEFLVSGESVVFLEVNPRIQVEHTVTEAVTGLDLVALQIHLARGASLADLGLPADLTPRGIAVQARVNLESDGTITAFTPPTGPGIRVDTFGRPGLSPSPRFDPLLAKVIAHAPTGTLDSAARKAATAIAEFEIDGVATNHDLLRRVLADDEFRSGTADTGFLDRLSGDAASVASADGELRAPLAGTVIETRSEGADVAAGAPVVVLEAMKMQHVVAAPTAGRVRRVLVATGRTVRAGDLLAVYSPTGVHDEIESSSDDLDRIRDDLAEIRHRHDVTLDAARPDAVAKIHARGRRTARENIADLVDPDSFVEYGALTIAAQRGRRSEQELIAGTPADGLVGGIATVGGAEIVVLSYDYSVLAGTQGARNHAKTDRMLELAARRHVPLVFFPEGGGGRPGDVDVGPGAGLDLTTFRAMAGLGGVVPTVAVVSGRCFAGNAALAGVCDVLIATRDANIGMGGPAMIEGGGLGVYRPEDIGAIDVQCRNGVVHVVADDEAHAVALARRYLGYFTGPTRDWTALDPRRARHVVPENRLRAYSVGEAVSTIADVDSVLELRPDYGVGILTALIRVEGTPLGVVANSSLHLGGAIDAEAADKAADFLAMCDAFRLPVLSLCDTPGFMVGPDAEREASVRRFGRLFAVGARLRVPFGMVVLRKAYGLGAMAMAAGSLRAPDFTVAWPTGEIGPMGLEGAVRLGFRKELDAAADPQALFAELLERAYRHGKALNAATNFELDDVIDPADTRAWVRRLARAR